MPNYCPECGHDLPKDADRHCPECGADTEPIQSVWNAASYSGSLVLFFFAFTSLLPVEGYQIWYASFVVFTATGIVTLPPVKQYLDEQTDREFGRWDSVATSISGFLLGLLLVPA